MNFHQSRYDALIPDTTRSKQAWETHGLSQSQEDGITETFALFFSFADERRPSQDTSPFMATYLLAEQLLQVKATLAISCIALLSMRRPGPGPRSPR